MPMTYQIAYEPDKGPLAHTVYQITDIKAPKVWCKSFATEAEAHRWIKANHDPLTFGSRSVGRY